MSNVSVKIATDNAAFRLEDGTLDRFEVARVMREAADKVEAGYSTGRLMDANGNDVGGFLVTEDS